RSSIRRAAPPPARSLSRARSSVERALFDAERRLAHDLGHRRMRVADARDVLGGGAELDRHHRLGDELARQAADGVHAEDAVARGVGEDLDEALRLLAPERAAVVDEREAAGL